MEKKTGGINGAKAETMTIYGDKPPGDILFNNI